MLFRFRVWMVAGICCCVLHAQYGPEIPIPKITRRHKTADGQDTDKDQRPKIENTGRVDSFDGKKLLVSSDDGRTFTLAVTDGTSFARDGKTIPAGEIQVGKRVSFVASQDEDGNLTAKKVEVVQPPAPKLGAGKPDAGVPAAPTAEESAPKNENMTTVTDTPVDAPDRPILRRGGPATRHAAGDSTPTTSRSEAGPKLAKADAKDDGLIMEPDPAAVAAAAQKGQKSNAPELVQKATNWVNSFAEDLPNFVCQQSTTRYVQQSKEQGWQAVDVVGAQIVYEDGRESYRSITIGGRPTNKSMLELGGSTSTGEFASTLRSLFSPASQAMFKLYQTTRFADSDATIFDFKVALRNSNWTINTGGQSLRPAYSGSVWIDRYSGEVRRIEMQADNIPGDFPMDSIEWAVEYGRVSLGTATYLLPTHAENLGCQRGSSTCMKNTIDFRNYHKFSGSSTVTFDK